MLGWGRGELPLPVIPQVIERANRLPGTPVYYSLASWLSGAHTPIIDFVCSSQLYCQNWFMATLYFEILLITDSVHSCLHIH